MVEPACRRAPLAAVGAWLDRNLFELGREMRLSYLSPLMVYVEAEIPRSWPRWASGPAFPECSGCRSATWWP
jgi:hypothetical protein